MSKRGNALRTPDSVVRFEQLQRLLDDLGDANVESPIVVEGLKDERALRQLGLTGTIVRLKTRSTIFAVCEEIARTARRAIVLTDWDAAGARHSRALVNGLRANGAAPNVDFRRAIAHLVRAEIHQVESLPALVDRLRQKAEEELERRERGAQMDAWPKGRIMRAKSRNRRTQNTR